MVENKPESWAKSLNSFVINYFRKNLSGFILKKETSHGPYWGVVFSDGNLEIKIGGDIAFNILLNIDSEDFSLWQFDRNANNAMDTSNKNIQYQLDILNRFLTENSKSGS